MSLCVHIMPAHKVSLGGTTSRDPSSGALMMANGSASCAPAANASCEMRSSPAAATGGASPARTGSPTGSSKRCSLFRSAFLHTANYKRAMPPLVDAAPALDVK